MYARIKEEKLNAYQRKHIQIRYPHANVSRNLLVIPEEAPVRSMWLEPCGKYVDWGSRRKEKISAFY